MHESRSAIANPGAPISSPIALSAYARVTGRRCVERCRVHSEDRLSPCPPDARLPRQSVHIRRGSRTGGHGAPLRSREGAAAHPGRPAQPTARCPCRTARSHSSPRSGSARARLPAGQAGEGDADGAGAGGSAVGRAGSGRMRTPSADPRKRSFTCPISEPAARPMVDPARTPFVPAAPHPSLA